MKDLSTIESKNAKYDNNTEIQINSCDNPANIPFSPSTMSTKISGLLISAITSAARTTAFTAIPRSSSRIGIVSITAQRTKQFSFRTTSTKPVNPPALFAAEPEPGPCPECSDENGYWDGATSFACIACGHEWPVGTSSTGGDQANTDDDGAVRDINGNIIVAGDTVVLTKELGKGLKKGLKIIKIRVGDFGDDHDCQGSIPGIGTFNLKSQFLKLKKTSK